MKKIFTSTLLLTLVFGIKASAQLSGVVNLPRISPPLPNLAAAINYLNTFGVSGAVTINCSANETAPSGGYVLGSALLNPMVGPGTSITINGNGRIFTAQSGTGSNDAIFSIQGTDFVTLSRFNFQESSTNTTATTMMEKGIAITKMNNNDGCKTISIMDSKISLNNTNTTAASGVNPFGSSGIHIGNCTPFSSAALTVPTISDGAIEGVYIARDTITNVNHGIFGNGTGVVIDGVAINDMNTTIQNNIIENFTHNGVFLVFFNGDLVTGNRINNMSSGGTAPTANSIAGITYSGATVATNNNWTCSNNVIDLTVGGSGFAATGILSQIIGTGTSDINNDTIKLTANGTSSQLIGIYGRNGSGTTTINKNYIYGFTTPSTSGFNVAGIWNGQTAPPVGYPTTCQITNNLITNFTIGGATGVYGCIDQNVFNTSPSIFTGNTVSNFTVLNSATVLKGYQFRNTVTTGAVTLTATGNTFKDLNASATSASLTIMDPAANTTVTANLSNNRFQNIAAGTGFLTGVQIDFGKSMTFVSDTFINLTGGADVIAYKAGFGGTAVPTIFFSKNFIDSLSSSGTSNVVEGLKVTTGTSNFITSCTFNNSMIKRIIATGSSAIASAISTVGGTTAYNFSNNIISDISSINNTASYSSSFGFNLTNSGTNNILFNTVNMQTSSTTASGYGATALLFNPSGANTVQNNIFHVNVLAGTTNNVSAVRSSAGSPSAAPSLSGFTAGSNIYHSPTGPNNYLYVEGTLNSGLVNGYHQSGLTANNTKNIVNDTFFNSECNKSSYHKFMQTASSSRERNTFTENNLSGTGGVFSPSGLSYAESSATDGAISVDFLLNPRPFGSSDIGALEFTGSVRPLMNISVSSSTGFDTACTFKLPVLSASIPSFFNRVSYQWYRDTTKIAGATSKIYSVGPLSSKYVVKVYDSVTGCEYSSTPFAMTIVPPPPAQITYYDSLTFCESSAIVLQANKGYNYSYKWMRNSAFLAGETDDHLVVDKSGDYVVEVNTPLGCASYSVPVRVKVYPLPKPTISWASPRVLTTQKYYLYQWYKNNIKIDSFAQNRTFFCFEDGAYSVEVTDSNGCTSKSDVYLFSLGIDEGAVSSSIKIYPNPAREQLYINSPIAVTAKLTDITGRVVKTQEQATELNLSDLSEGMYLLSIMDKEGNLIRVEKINKIK